MVKKLSNHQNDGIKSFGWYISDRRKHYSISCRELSQRIGISTAYLSQLEHGIRLNPEPILILKISEALNLTHEEAMTLFDLYAEASGQLPPDITEYLSENQIVQHALRQARDANATEADWQKFIEQLKK